MPALYIARWLLAINGLWLLPGISLGQERHFDFFNEPFSYTVDSTISVTIDDTLSTTTIRKFYAMMAYGNHEPLVAALLRHQKNYKLNDWLYYQLVRRVAQELSPKGNNYIRYTLYKWFLMVKSGFDARLAYRGDQLIFYIQSEDDIEDLPYFTLDNNTYICLNYHDYGELFNLDNPYTLADIADLIDDEPQSFSYRITRLPDFKDDSYVDKELRFNYKGKTHHLTVKVNTEVATIFKNYPIVDFGMYFNIPLSAATYASLIPVLKEQVQGLPTEKGVDYLMRFTRQAFAFEDDHVTYGQEKRMSPEETLLNNSSDCDDRTALFFYLVKEIYDLPMVTLRYPTHVTIAVRLDQPVGQYIDYNGYHYTICEPTPQGKELGLGELSDKHRNEKYEVVYSYMPHAASPDTL